MKCSIMLQFIWVLTVCKITHLGVSQIQRIKKSVCIIFMLCIDNLFTQGQCNMIFVSMIFAESWFYIMYLFLSLVEQVSVTDKIMNTLKTGKLLMRSLLWAILLWL